MGTAVDSQFVRAIDRAIQRQLCHIERNTALLLVAFPNTMPYKGVSLSLSLTDYHCAFNPRSVGAGLPCASLQVTVGGESLEFV